MRSKALALAIFTMAGTPWTADAQVAADAAQRPVRMILSDAQTAASWNSELWWMRLWLGPQFRTVEHKEGLEGETRFALADGTELDARASDSLGYQALYGGVGQFRAAIANRTIVRSRNPRTLPRAAADATTIYAIAPAGSENCNTCQQMAGRLASYVEAARRRGSKINIVYIELDIPRGAMSLSSLIRGLHDEGQLAYPMPVPAFVVSAGGSVKSVAETRAYMDQLIPSTATQVGAPRPLPTVSN